MSKARGKSISYSKKKLSFLAVNFRILPVMAVLILVPFVVHLYVFHSSLSEFKWFMANGTAYDTFLYYRGSVFFAIVCVMAFMFVALLPSLFGGIKDEAKQAAPWLIALGVFTLFALVSTLASPYKKYGLKGNYETFETIWVVMGYVLAAAYTYFMVRSEKNARVLRVCGAVLVGALSFVGLLQLAGLDPLSSALGRLLIVPDKYSAARESMTIWAEETTDHRVYMTLFNQNYVGVFSSVFLPVLVLSAFTVKGGVKKAIYGVLAAVLLLVTLGSGSRTFILVMGGMVLAFAVIFRKYLLRAWKILVPAVLIAAVLGGLYFAKAGVNPLEYLKRGFALNENDYFIQNITTDAEGIHVLTSKGVLNVGFDRYSGGSELETYIMLSDEEGMNVDSALDAEGYLVPTKEEFKSLTFGVIPVSDTGLTGYSAMIAMRVTPQEMFYFAKKEDSGEYVFINSTLREDTFHNSETGSYFANHYEFLNYRGYVWAHTVPLLKKHILLGGGAESFVIDFPNDDYIARYNVGYSDQLVNKPHNLYLQIWMLYGFPALLAFLAAAVWYFIDSVKTYKGADLSIPSTGLGIGLALGVFGYLVCGLANDSCVAVAPLFWVMWGFGMAVNKLARKSRKEA